MLETKQVERAGLASGKMQPQLICSIEQNFKKKTLLRKKLVSVKRLGKGDDQTKG